MSKETDSKLFRASPDGQTTVEDQPKSDKEAPTHLNAMSFSTHILSLNMTTLMHLGEVEEGDLLQRTAIVQQPDT